MSTALEVMRAKARAEITLPSGLNIVGQLPRIRDCIIAGEIPLPVVAHIEVEAKKNGGAPNLTTEQMQAAARFNDEVVIAFVKEIEGEEVTLSRDDLGLFAEDDFNECVLYATRAKPLPGKD